MKGHARQIMVPGDVVIPLEASFVRAAALMREADVSALAVMDTEGNLFGVVSEEDVLEGLLARKGSSGRVKMGLDKNFRTVGEFMPAGQVVELMRDEEIRYLPVVRQGAVVGLITPGSLMSYLVAQGIGPV